MRLFALVFVFAVLVPAFAFADVAFPPITPTVDLGPLVGQLIEIAYAIFGPAVAAALLGVVLRIYQFFGVKTSGAKQEAIRATVDHGLDRAIGFARAKVGGAVPVAIGVTDPRIAIAAGYALNTIPDTLKTLGIVDAASEKLAEMVEARLEPVPAGPQTAG